MIVRIINLQSLCIPYLIEIQDNSIKIHHLLPCSGNNTPQIDKTSVGPQDIFRWLQEPLRLKFLEVRTGGGTLGLAQTCRKKNTVVHARRVSDHLLAIAGCRWCVSALFSKLACAESELASDFNFEICSCELLLAENETRASQLQYKNIETIDENICILLNQYTESSVLQSTWWSTCYSTAVIHETINTQVNIMHTFTKLARCNKKGAPSCSGRSPLWRPWSSVQ